MTRTAWSRSGARPAARRDPRPPDSFGVAVARARAWFDHLQDRRMDAARSYSDEAVAAILATAVALWPDVAAELSRGDED